MKKILSIIILLCAGIAYSQDDPNALSAKIAQLEKTIARQERIIEKQKTKLEEQEKEIKRLFALCRQNRIETNPQKTTKRPKYDGIAKTFHWPWLEVGQIAYLGGKPNMQEFTRYKVGSAYLQVPHEPMLKIIQIIDEQNAIVDFCWTFIPPADGKDYGSLYRCDTVWVKGISTTNLVDGGRIKTDKPLKITGTKTYDTADGTNTIFLIEPYEPL